MTNRGPPSMNPNEPTPPPLPPGYSQPPPPYVPPYPQAQQYQQPYQPPPAPYYGMPIDDQSGKATAGFVLGCVAILAWCLPIVGLPLTITGLVLSVKGLTSAKRGQAIAGVILNSIGLLLSLVNAAIGAYMGMHGQLAWQKH